MNKLLVIVGLCTVGVIFGLLMSAIPLVGWFFAIPVGVVTYQLGVRTVFALGIGMLIGVQPFGWIIFGDVQPIGLRTFFITLIPILFWIGAVIGQQRAMIKTIRTRSNTPPTNPGSKVQDRGVDVGNVSSINNPNNLLFAGN